MDAQTSDRRLTWRIAVVGCLFALGVGLLGVGAVWQLAAGGDEPAVGAGPPDRRTAQEREAAERSRQRALKVLHDWDARRSAAWAAGDPAGLRALYTPGSGSARTDVRRLRAWTDRGFVVTGLRTQVLAVEVLVDQPRRLDLRVRDRVAAGEATSEDRRVRLPRDGVSTWQLSFVQRDGRWLLAESVPVN
jgi:hypothetical protein